MMTDADVESRTDGRVAFACLAAPSAAHNIDIYLLRRQRRQRRQRLVQQIEMSIVGGRGKGKKTFSLKCQLLLSHALSSYCCAADGQKEAREGASFSAYNV